MLRLLQLMPTRLGYAFHWGEMRNTEKGRIIENPNASNYVVAEAAEFAGVMMGVLLGCLL